MIRFINVIALLVACALSFACSNPAANVSKATVASAASPASGVSAAEGEKIAVTPDSSQVAFTGSKVTGSESGRFEKFGGAIYLVNGRPEASRVEIDIDMGSVVTDSKGLADHLKSADFFDVPKYPKATFISTAIKPGGEKGATHTVTGDLELHGVKKSISFPATINVEGGSVYVDSEFALNRKDFGIMYAGRTNDLIRDEVVLRLKLNVPRAKG